MIVCAECEQTYKVVKVGVPLEEQFKADGRPYRLWMTDRLRCACGHEIAVTQNGQEPIAEHYQENYAEIRARYSPRVIVRV